MTRIPLLSPADRPSPTPNGDVKMEEDTSNGSYLNGEDSRQQRSPSPVESKHSSTLSDKVSFTKETAKETKIFFSYVEKSS